jgi:hypothetical protein
MGIKAYKQIEALSVTLNLLDQDTQDKIGKIDTIESDLNDLIDSKGQNSGITPLDANGFVPTAHIKALYIGNTFVAADEAAMLVAEATDKRGVLTAVELGDVMIRSDLGGTSYKLGGNDPTVLANWVKLFDAQHGVTGVLIDGTTHTGLVSLAKIAETGDVADLTGLADIATSGNAADVAIADAGGLYDATTAEAAFAEVMEKVNQEVTDRTNAINSAKTAVILVKGTLTGTKNGTNTSFTIGGLDTSKALFLYRDGIEQLSSGFATRDGATVTTAISAPESDEAMEVFGYPN